MDFCERTFDRFTVRLNAPCSCNIATTPTKILQLADEFLGPRRRNLNHMADDVFWVRADEFFAIMPTNLCGICRRNSEYFADEILVLRAEAFFGARAVARAAS